VDNGDGSYVATYTSGLSDGAVVITARANGAALLETIELTITPTFLLAANSVTVVCSDALDGQSGQVGGITYTRRTRAGLDSLIAVQDYAPLASTCTSGITDMGALLQGAATFNEDISSWDVSNVTNTGAMFDGAVLFDRPIGDWDVSAVSTMPIMFRGATSFNQPIGAWNTGSVTDMNAVFYGASSFNQPLAGWNVSNVVSMNSLFESSGFDQDIGNWNVSLVTGMVRMFMNSPFNRDISSWDVGSVGDMGEMFLDAVAFNQDIGSWDVSGVFTMDGMFANASAFDQDLSQWCVELIGTAPADFDTGASSWVGLRPFWGICPSAAFALAPNNVTVQCDAALPGEQGVVGGVVYTKRSRAELDAFVAQEVYAPLAATCTSGITDLSSLFAGTPDLPNPFNEDISSWDVSSVTTTRSMFYYAAAFDQAIGPWDVSNVIDMNDMFRGAAAFNADITGWNVGNVIDMGQMFEYATAFNQNIGGWDVSNVNNMRAMFFRTSFNQPIGSWNVGSVANMSYMFEGVSAFNQDITGWNVGSLVDAGGMFRDATSFNQDISGWDLGSAVLLSEMFRGATAFNQPIGAWDVRAAQDMSYMFQGAALFNQDLGGWNVSGVANMDGMFQNALVFDQDLSGWCVTDIPSAPTDFDAGAAAWLAPRPVWGSCLVYAASVLDFSSEFGSVDWAASQALGAPDLYPTYADDPRAWAPLTPDGQREFLELGLPSPLSINYVAVYETFRPGSVDRLLVRNSSTAQWEEVWTGVAAEEADVARIFTIVFPQTGYPVDAVRLELDSPAVSSWNEIDAVGVGTIAEAPIGISTATLPAAQVGVAFNSSLVATGGDGSHSWSEAFGSGPLPDGLSLSANGVISGVPTVAGSWNIEVQVASGAQVLRRGFTITVNP
jgi:surface protein